MNTIGQHLGLLVLGNLADAFCYCAIGQQHEFLHQLIGILGHLEVNTGGLAFFVYLETNLATVKIDGTV